MWQAWLATGFTLALGVSLFAVEKHKSRLRTRERARKLAALAAEGFQFSKEYDFGSAVLLVDQVNRQWCLLQAAIPGEGRVMAFSDIDGVRLLSRQRLTSAAQGFIGGAALRSSLSQREKKPIPVDTVSGVEISLKGEQVGAVLFVDCLRSEYSAERVEAIFSSLMERGMSGPAEGEI